MRWTLKKVTIIFTYLTLLLVSLVSTFGLGLYFDSSFSGEVSSEGLASAVLAGDSCVDYGITSANSNSNKDVFVNCGGFLP